MCILENDHMLKDIKYSLKNCKRYQNDFAIAEIYYINLFLKNIYRLIMIMYSMF